MRAARHYTNREAASDAASNAKAARAIGAYSDALDWDLMANFYRELDPEKPAPKIEVEDGKITLL